MLRADAPSAERRRRRARRGRLAPASAAQAPSGSAGLPSATIDWLTSVVVASCWNSAPMTTSTTSSLRLRSYCGVGLVQEVRPQQVGRRRPPPARTAAPRRSSTGLGSFALLVDLELPVAEVLGDLLGQARHAAAVEDLDLDVLGRRAAGCWPARSPSGQPAAVVAPVWRVADQRDHHEDDRGDGQHADDDERSDSRKAHVQAPRSGGTAGRLPSMPPRLASCPVGQRESLGCVRRADR